MENTHTEVAIKKSGSADTRKYIYMRMLQKLFTKPINLLNSASLTFRQKSFLLNKWVEEREEYLTDTQEGSSKDSEMTRLVKAMRELNDKPMRFN